MIQQDEATIDQTVNSIIMLLGWEHMVSNKRRDMKLGIMYCEII